MYDYELLEYGGPRSAESVAQFALERLTVASIVPTKMADIKQLLKNDLVFFLGYDCKVYKTKPYEVVSRAMQQVKRILPSIHICPELESLAELGIKDKGPSLVVFKNGQSSVYPGKIVSGSEADVQKWLKDNRTPLVTRLNEDTQKELLMKDLTLVLGVFDVLEMESDFKKLLKVAALHPSLRFAYLDAFKYQKYISTVYKISTDQLPRVVIVKPSDEQYWDSFDHEHIITLDTLDTAVSEFKLGKLTAKSTRGSLFGYFQSAKRAVLSLFNSTSAVFVIAAILILVLLRGLRSQRSNRETAYSAVKNE